MHRTALLNQPGSEAYFGAYCFDQFPTSPNSNFLSNYYAAETNGHVDYLLFTED